MCLDDCDFPLPAVRERRSEKKRHMQEETGDKKVKQQSSPRSLMYCLSPGQYRLSNTFSVFALLDKWFCCAQCCCLIDHRYDFPKWAVGGGWYIDG